jgi:hypothetical protein
MKEESKRVRRRNREIRIEQRNVCSKEINIVKEGIGMARSIGTHEKKTELGIDDHVSSRK